LCGATFLTGATTFAPGVSSGMPKLM